eukprot:6784065-Prymnesium_polylepis.1
MRRFAPPSSRPRPSVTSPQRSSGIRLPKSRGPGVDAGALLETFSKQQPTGTGQRNTQLRGDLVQSEGTFSVPWSRHCVKPQKSVQDGGRRCGSPRWRP